MSKDKMVVILGSSIVVELMLPKSLVDDFDESFGNAFKLIHPVHGFPVSRTITVYNEIPGGVYATVTLADIDELVRFNLLVADFCKDKGIGFEKKSKEKEE